MSPQLQAWIRVATVTIGAFMTAYSGVASDEYVSSAEWVSIFGTTILAALNGLSSAPKDARDAQAKTKATDPPVPADQAVKE